MNNNNSVIPIKEVVNHVNNKVDLLGVILEFSFPRKSQGTDYVSILKIVDESQVCPELSVHIFTETLDQLPHVQSHGDLILLRNVTIRRFDGEVSAVFNKKFSMFALFDGKVSSCCKPYQSCPKSFFVVERDSIIRLRNWRCNIKFSSGASEYLFQLKDMSDNKYFDLVCKVLFVCEVSNDEWMLFVWDGTDNPPLSLHRKLQDEEHNSLPLQIEPSPLPRNILGQFHCVGTVLRVTADKTHENLGPHFTYIGKWVRIRNMTSKVLSGMWHGILKSSSKIRLLSDKDDIVLERKRKYNERKEHGRFPLSYSPSSNCLTVVDDQHVPCLTLMDILTHSKVNVGFCCIVRVVAVHPWPDGLRKYKMRLTLEDPTARIHALLRRKNWVKFFEGYSSIDARTTKMKELLGVPEHHNVEEDSDSPRSPPWIKCFIYKSDTMGNQHYHIFCTRLCT